MRLRLRLVLVLLGALLTCVLGITPACATIFYASPSGSGGCVTSRTSPGSLGSTLGCMGAGDELRLRTGTYGCGSCLVDTPSGSSTTNRVTITGDPDDGQRPATLTLNGGQQDLNGGHAFITWKNLKLNKTTSSQKIKISAGGHHIRFENVDIAGGGTSGMGILANAAQGNTGDVGGNEVLDSDIHDHGIKGNCPTGGAGGDSGDGNCDQQFHHGLYFCTNNAVIRGNRIFSNAACGVHLYCSGGPIQNNQIYNNEIYNHNTCNGSPCCGSGILITAGGANNIFYNNRMHDNNKGIQAWNDGVKVWNNTQHNISNWCFSPSDNSPDFTNNICSNVGSTFESGCPNCGQTTNYIGNGAALDSTLHLTASSPSPPRNAGTNLSGSLPSGMSSNDFEGTARPGSGQGAWDIGADQFGSGSSCTCPSGCTCTQVACTCDSQQGQQAPMAWWKFDEGTGTTASDAADSNTATLSGGATWGTGRVGAFAAQLDGADDVITLQNSVLTAFNGNHSVCMWVQPGSATTKHSSGFEQTLLNLSADASNGVRMNMQTDAATPGLWWVTILDGGSPLAARTTTQVFTTGTWVHLCYTRVSSTLTLYVNSVAQTTASDNRYDPEGVADVLGARTATTGNFQGKMDEVKIWNRALSATEVQTEFSGGGTVVAIPRHRMVVK